MIRRRKVEENLQQLMQQEMEFKEETGEAIRNRWKIYEQNRVRNQENKSKEHKQQ